MYLKMDTKYLDHDSYSVLLWTDKCGIGLGYCQSVTSQQLNFKDHLRSSGLATRLQIINTQFELIDLSQCTGSTCVIVGGSIMTSQH